MRVQLSLHIYRIRGSCLDMGFSEHLYTMVVRCAQNFLNISVADKLIAAKQVRAIQDPYSRRHKVLDS